METIWKETMANPNPRNQFVKGHKASAVRRKRFSPNQPFAQEIGILTSKFPLMSSLEVMRLEKIHQKKLFLIFFILLQKLQIIKRFL